MNSKSKVGVALILVALFLLFDAANSYATSGGSGNLIVTTVAQGGGALAGEIYIDGVATSQGSANVTLPAGSHSVSFGSLTGYTAPAPVPVTVLDRKTATVQGVYVASTSTNPCPTGYVLQNGVCVPSATTTPSGSQTTTPSGGQTTTGSGSQTTTSGGTSSPPQMSNHRRWSPRARSGGADHRRSLAEREAAFGRQRPVDGHRKRPLCHSQPYAVHDGQQRGRPHHPL